jgi:hypothetical protein
LKKPNASVEDDEVVFMLMERFIYEVHQSYCMLGALICAWYDRCYDPSYFVRLSSLLLLSSSKSLPSLLVTAVVHIAVVTLWPQHLLPKHGSASMVALCELYEVLIAMIGSNVSVLRL